MCIRDRLKTLWPFPEEEVKEVAELCLVVPSEETPRVQEVHITLAHILCELAEDELF